jgi:PPOX class probable F420-dependent enzyme
MEQITIMATQDDLTALIQAHRIGHLATADGAGAPHLVPLCFIYDCYAIYSAIDHKPKRRTGYSLRRIRNIVENPRVAFLVHHYEEDWQQLYYVLIRGTATVLDHGPERQQALALLEEKYVQYQERQLTQSDGLVIKIVPQSIQRWGWQDVPTRLSG